MHLVNTPAPGAQCEFKYHIFIFSQHTGSEQVFGSKSPVLTGNLKSLSYHPLSSTHPYSQVCNDLGGSEIRNLCGERDSG